MVVALMVEAPRSGVGPGARNPGKLVGQRICMSFSPVYREGMSTIGIESGAVRAKKRRTTLSLSEDLLDRIAAVVARGDSPSLSAFVEGALRMSLDEVEYFDVVEEILALTGGPATDEELAEADRRAGRCPR